MVSVRFLAFFFFLSITKAILVLFAITPKVRTIFKIFKEMSVQSLFFDSVATTMFLFFFFFRNIGERSPPDTAFSTTKSRVQCPGAHRKPNRIVLL